MSALIRAPFFVLVGSVVIVACGGAEKPPSSPGAGGEEGSSKGSTAEPVKDEPPAGPPRDVDCGDFSTCAISTDGSVHCWGRDKRGELGDGAGSGQQRSK